MVDGLLADTLCTKLVSERVTAGTWSRKVREHDKNMDMIDYRDHGRNVIRYVIMTDK